MVKLYTFSLVVFFKLHSKDEYFKREAAKKKHCDFFEGFFLIAMFIFNIIFNKLFCLNILPRIHQIIETGLSYNMNMNI